MNACSTNLSLVNSAISLLLEVFSRRLFVAIYSQVFPAMRAQGTIHDQPADIDLDEAVSEDMSDEP